MIRVKSAVKDKCFECHEPASITISVETNTGIMWMSFCHTCSKDLSEKLDNQVRELDYQSYYSDKENIIDLYLTERRFKRSKHRSKSWVFPCKECGTRIDDAVAKSYWRDDTTGSNFCSKECGVRYVSSSAEFKRLTN